MLQKPLTTVLGMSSEQYNLPMSLVYTFEFLRNLCCWQVLFNILKVE